MCLAFTRDYVTTNKATVSLYESPIKEEPDRWAGQFDERWKNEKKKGWQEAQPQWDTTEGSAGSNTMRDEKTL